jgi:two-component system, cell cycle response regulator DivK
MTTVGRRVLREMAGQASAPLCSGLVRDVSKPHPMEEVQREPDMPKVLLVEDNEMNMEMLSRRLVRKGYEVIPATDGEQGIAIAQTQKPDLILMDMSLPVISGWDATRSLKASPTTQSIPVIALTAHAQSRDREQALQAGCDDFETKPIELLRLLQKMESLLGKATAKD